MRRSGTDTKLINWLLALWLLMSACVAIAEPRLALTADEQQWLKTVDEIRLCSDPDWMPYEGIDEQGQHTGIMSDFHLLWSQMLDKPVVLQATDSWQQSLRFMSREHIERYVHTGRAPAGTDCPDPLRD